LIPPQCVLSFFFLLARFFHDPVVEENWCLSFKQSPPFSKTYPYLVFHPRSFRLTSPVPFLRPGLHRRHRFYRFTRAVVSAFPARGRSVSGCYARPPGPCVLPTPLPPPHPTASYLKPVRWSHSFSRPASPHASDPYSVRSSSFSNDFPFYSRATTPNHPPTPPPLGLTLLPCFTSVVRNVPLSSRSPVWISVKVFARALTTAKDPPLCGWPATF